MERFYRPVAPPESRARLPKQIDIRPNQPRAFPDPVKDDDDEDREDAFLRARRRVPIRRGIIPKSKGARIGLAAAVLSAKITPMPCVPCKSFTTTGGPCTFSMHPATWSAWRV